MSSDTERKTGPILDAVSGMSEHEVDYSVSPEELLGSLLDIRGSVELEKFLSGDVPLLTRGDPVPDEALRAQTSQGIETIRSRLEQACHNAYRPRYRLPSAERAWGILKRTGVIEARVNQDKKAFKKSFRSGSRLIWAPFGEFLETHLKRARFAMQELRDQLGPGIASRGEKSAQLERLDRVLRLAIEPEVRSLYLRVNRANEHRFGTTMRYALDELPDVAELEGFALSFTEEGWLGEVFGHGQTMIKAIVEHEIHQLQLFVDSGLNLSRD